MYVKVLNQSLSAKRSLKAVTTRKLTWKQSSFEESVTAHWSSFKALKIIGTKEIDRNSIFSEKLSGSRTLFKQKEVLKSNFGG